MSIRAFFNAKAPIEERQDSHDASREYSPRAAGHQYSPQDVGDDDSYHSDGGDAVAQIRALTKRSRCRDTARSLARQ